MFYVFMFVFYVYARRNVKSASEMTYIVSK